MLDSIFNLSSGNAVLCWRLIALTAGWFLFLRRRNLLAWRRFATWRRDEPLRTYLRASIFIPHMKRRVWLFAKEVSSTRDEIRSSISFPSSWTERMRETYRETGSLKAARSKRRRKSSQKRKVSPSKPSAPPKIKLVAGKDIENRRAA